MTWYRDDAFEWDEEESQACRARTGFDFYAAKTIFSHNFLERVAQTEGEVPIISASGFLRNTLITVIYMEIEGRKRILDAFKADRDDQLDYILTYGLG